MANMDGPEYGKKTYAEALVLVAAQAYAIAERSRKLALVSGSIPNTASVRAASETLCSAVEGLL